MMCGRHGMTMEQQYIFDTVCECITEELELRDPVDCTARIADLFHSDEAWYATIERISYEFDITLDPEALRRGTVAHLCAVIEGCV